MVGDPRQARDATQEAYARAWREWAAPADHRAPETWVRATVTRLANDLWRRPVGVRGAPTRAAVSFDGTQPAREDVALLAAALRRLPADQRQALALHHVLRRPSA